MPLSPVIASLSEAAAACVALVRDGSRQLNDDDLVALQSDIAASARLLDVAAAALAAEVAVRSRPELGYAGLAQKRGMRTPEALVQQATGVTAQTARRLVRVGTIVSELDSPTPSANAWMRPLTLLVASGALAADALDPLRAALGSPSESVPPAALLAVAQTLALECRVLPIEKLVARARELRDELDASGVAEREAERRDRRFLRLFAQPDGMTRISGLLDPESAAVIVAVIDDVTSPRRGGPRFVDPAVAARAQAGVQDSRTTEQLALDALVELVDVALRHRFAGTVGSRRPDVRVLVTQADLDRRQGVGYLEGQTASVSVPTVERLACDGGLVPIMFDDSTGAALNLGRSQRLHTARQRVVISVRDGGCIAPGCDRPPSWCEVHHIHEFSKGGSTDLADGVLLCRHHHLLVHNNGWRISRQQHAYWLVPPPEIDPNRVPIRLTTKSAAVRRLVGAGRGDMG